MCARNKEVPVFSTAPKRNKLHVSWLLILSRIPINIDPRLYAPVAVFTMLRCK